MVWKLCCLPVLVTLHPKTNSESEVFHDNFVDLGRRHYKYANVFSHIKVNLTAVEMLFNVRNICLIYKNYKQLNISYCNEQ